MHPCSPLRSLRTVESSVPLLLKSPCERIASFMSTARVWGEASALADHITALRFRSPPRGRHWVPRLRPAIHGRHRRRPDISLSIETVTVRSKISTAARVDILQSHVVSFLSQERNQEVRERRTTRTQYRRAGTCRDRKLCCKCVVQVPAPLHEGYRAWCASSEVRKECSCLFGK